jgi:hypothetical protein
MQNLKKNKYLKNFQPSRGMLTRHSSSSGSGSCSSGGSNGERLSLPLIVPRGTNGSCDLLEVRVHKRWKLWPFGGERSRKMEVVTFWRWEVTKDGSCYLLEVRGHERWKLWPFGGETSWKMEVVTFWRWEFTRRDNDWPIHCLLRGKLWPFGGECYWGMIRGVSWQPAQCVEAKLSVFSSHEEGF